MYSTSTYVFNSASNIGFMALLYFTRIITQVNTFKLITKATHCKCYIHAHHMHIFHKPISETRHTPYIYSLASCIPCTCWIISGWIRLSATPAALFLTKRWSLRRARIFPHWPAYYVPCFTKPIEVLCSRHLQEATYLYRKQE